jgi:hypothetical protein
MRARGRRVIQVPSLLYPIARVHARAYFHLPYRQTEGVVRAHAKSSSVPSIPDYSTLCRRINSLDIRVDEKVGNNIVIALDSTAGIKVANRGEEWMRHKWHVRRGYLKIHVWQLTSGRKRRLSQWR